MVVIHGTGRFRDRVPAPDGGADRPTTAALGNWYATVLFWRPQVALFVNEATLLPVLMPLAPAASVLARFPEAVAGTLRAHGLQVAFIEREAEQLADCRLAKTESRSVVGSMNGFRSLAEHYYRDREELDLMELALRLAETPCGPLYSTHLSPDRALLALATARG